MRRGLGKGLGTGYFNLVPMDSHIHSLSAKGVKSKIPTQIVSGKNYDFGMIPTPKKKGFIKEIAKKVVDGVKWAEKWEKEHLPKQKAWVKKEFEKGKDLYERGADKVKDYFEQKKEDMDDVRDELDTNDDGVQDISYGELMNTNLQIQQDLNTIDVDNSGVPDHLEDGTFAFQDFGGEGTLINSTKPLGEEKKGAGFPFPTLDPQKEYGSEDGTELLTNIPPQEQKYEDFFPDEDMAQPIQSDFVVEEKKGVGLPLPTLNPKKTFGQKVKDEVQKDVRKGVEFGRGQIQKYQLEKDMIRHLPDKDLEIKALQVGKPLFGKYNKFEAEILRRNEERKRIAMIKSGKVPESSGSDLNLFGFLNPLSTVSTKKQPAKSNQTQPTSQSAVDLGFLNPFSTLTSNKGAK